MNWNDLKIGTKILIGFLSVALIALVIGVISFISLNNVGGSFNEVAEVRMPSVTSLQDMSLGFEKLKVAFSTLLIPGLSKDDINKQFDNIEKAREQYLAAIKIYEPLPQTKLEAELWPEFKTKLEEWRNVNKEVEKLVNEIVKKDLGNPYRFLQDVTQFRSDHNALEAKCLNAIHTGKSFDGGDDHTQCNFGKWLAGFKTENPIINNALNSFLYDHELFHESVKKIKMNVASGNRVAASSIFSNQLAPAVSETFKHFDDMI